MKLNVRNAAIDIIREGLCDLIDEIDGIVDEVIAAEAAYDAADEEHFWAHQEWSGLDHFGPDDDEAWEIREESIANLAKARKRLIDAYENAGISPREMHRTEYEYKNDGKRIRRGYELTVTTNSGSYSRCISNFDAAMDTATDMAYEAMDDNTSYPNGYVEKVTFDVTEKTGEEWYERSGYVLINRHIALFDTEGWNVGTRKVVTTRVDVTPNYLRY